jgi:beta-mannosidase
MLAHQKNNEGNSIIHDYLLKDYSEPKDFASFLYVSQVLQAEGIKIGAEHFRRLRPGDDGLHLLAVERLLAGGLVVVD